MRNRCQEEQRQARRLRCRGARLDLMLVATALALALLVPSAAFATALPGTIKENMTLAPVNSPYIGTSTIESGVTVKAEPVSNTPAGAGGR